MVSWLSRQRGAGLKSQIYGHRFRRHGAGRPDGRGDAPMVDAGSNRSWDGRPVAGDRPIPSLDPYDHRSAGVFHPGGGNRPHGETPPPSAGSGAKTLGWFLIASIVSLTLGLAMVHLLQPGLGLALPTGANAQPAVPVSGFTLRDFITHLVPVSIADAMARNEIFADRGVLLVRGLGHRRPGRPRARVAESGRATGRRDGEGYRLRHGLRAAGGIRGDDFDGGHPGAGHLRRRRQVRCRRLYLALAILWALLLAIGTAAARGRLNGLLGVIREPMLLAFSTARRGGRLSLPAHRSAALWRAA